MPPQGINHVESERAARYTKDENDQSIHSNMIMNDLEETYEIIFQLHKEKGGSVRWHNDTLGRNPPQNWYVARENLKNVGIIYSAPSPKTTILSPKVIH